MKFRHRLLYLFTNKLKLWVKVEDSTITEVPSICVGFFQYSKPETTVINESE